MRPPVERTLPAWIEHLSRTLVLASVSLFLVEVDVLHTRHSLEGGGVPLGVERVIAVLLTLEYLLRANLAPDRLRYLLSTRGTFDLLAILPFWVGFFLPPEYLGAIRTFRVLRLLKFYRYSEAMQNFMAGIKRARPRLIGLGYFVFVLLFFGSVLMHELEGAGQPEKFGTISGSAWYMIVTFTTVGYGDVFPLTPAGKLVAACFMILGVGLLAALLGIVGGACLIQEEQGERDERLDR